MKYKSKSLAGHNILLSVYFFTLALIRYYSSDSLLIIIFYPLIPFVLISIPLALLWTVNILNKNIDEIKLFAFIPLFIVLAGIFVQLFVPFTDIKLEIDFKGNYDSRLKVIELINNSELISELIADENGYIKLPDEYKNTSKDGKIQIEYEGGTKKVIFFTFIGLIDNFSGYVYNEQDTFLKDYHFSSCIIQCIKKTDNWYFCAFS